MERLVEVVLSKVNILSILHCYCRLFPLIYISYDSEEIKIQGSCEDRKILATMVIPRDSFECYECKESLCIGAPGPMVIALPLHLGKLGGRCVSIEVWTAGELRMYLSQTTEFRTKLLVAICLN